jgi:hypothetical protein
MNLSIWITRLYENHSHQKTNNKTGGYVNIYLSKSWKADETRGSYDEEGLDKTDYMF